MLPGLGTLDTQTQVVAYLPDLNGSNGYRRVNFPKPYLSAEVVPTYLPRYIGFSTSLRRLCPNGERLLACLGFSSHQTR